MPVTLAPTTSQPVTPLFTLRGQVKACHQCALRSGCLAPVPGNGNEKARVFFIGERPGLTEDEESVGSLYGWPFHPDAPAGAELNVLLKHIGLRREDVWVSNTVRCSHPTNKKPTPSEAKFCGNLWLEQELEIIRPELVVAVGVTAAEYFLGHQDMADIAGLPHEIERGWGRFTLIPVFHPSSMLHSPTGAPLVYRSFEYVGKWLNGWRPVVDDNRLGVCYEQIETIRDLEACWLAMPKNGLIALDTENRPDQRRQKAKKPRRRKQSEPAPEPEADPEESVSSADPDVSALEKALQPPEPPLGQLWCVTIAYAPGRAFWVPNKPELMAFLSEHLKEQRVVMHYSLHDMTMLASVGIFLDQIEDTMQAAYCLTRPLLGLKRLAKEHTGLNMIPFIQACPGGDPELLHDEQRETFINYSLRDPDATLRLWHVLEPELKARPQFWETYRMDMDTMHLNLEMTLNGMPVIPEELEAIEHRLDTQVVDAAAKCREIVAERWPVITQGTKMEGKEFNPGSPRQVSFFLSNQPGVKSKVRKKTSTGDLSTGVKVLERLKDTQPIAQAVLDFRVPKKLNSTYVKPLIKFARTSQDGRIRGRISTARTATARVAMSAPNLQNIPIRTELGREIRQTFKARQGWKLLSADLAQSELRGLAHYSRDPLLIQAFQSGRDIHTETAIQCWGDELQQKFQAQVVRFGLPMATTSAELLTVMLQRDPSGSVQKTLLTTRLQNWEDHGQAGRFWKCLLEQATEAKLQDEITWEVLRRMAQHEASHGAPFPPQLFQQYRGEFNLPLLTTASTKILALLPEWDGYRDRAKRVGFGVPYMISAAGLRDQLGGTVTVEEAQDYLDTYFQIHPYVRAYMNHAIAMARQTGYIGTIWGWRRYVPGINGASEQLRAAAEREVVNLPIQNYNATILKKGMAGIRQGLDEQHLQALPLVQVHDELVFEVPEEELMETARVVKACMEAHQILIVPVIASIKIGDRWGGQIAYQVQ